MFITVNLNAFRVLQHFMEPSVDTAPYITRSTVLMLLHYFLYKL